MKKLLLMILTFVSIITICGCQSTENKQTKIEDKLILAATAYVKGFVQGDKSKFDDYYGSGALDRDIERQFDEIKPSGASENTVSLDLWKQIVSKSRNMYAKAEVVSITKKNDLTANIKIKPLAVKTDDREAWVTKKQAELSEAVSRGDEQAIQRLNGLLGEVFDAIASGEIPSELEIEETYEMNFTEKDGKFYPVDDTNTIMSHFFKNK